MTDPLLYPPAVWKPIPSHGGPMTEQRGIVEHITTNDFSPFGFFSNPKNQASSHLWIAADGTVEQYIDLRLKSWAQAGGNSGWISVEISGKPGTLKTLAQCEAFAQFLAWATQHPELKTQLTATDSPTVPGVGYHQMGGPAWGGHPCPGSQRVVQTRSAVLPHAVALTQPATPEDIVTPQDIEAVAKRAAELVRQDLITLLRGTKDGSHPANIASIKADTEAIRTKLSA
jgi:hypothetical protein